MCRPSRKLPAAFLLLSLLALKGCGKDEVRLVPVAGVLTVEGKPLAGAGIAFQADIAKGNQTPHIAAGASDAEGKFELTTTTRKGAPPGWYKVAVFPPVGEVKGGEMPAPGKTPYDRKYSDPKTTDLSIEVKEGTKPGGYNIDLKK